MEKIVNINFEVETPSGSINFTGQLSKDEVDYLLEYALFNLLQRGMLQENIVTERKPTETVN